MNHDLAVSIDQATERYGYFLNILRSQVDVVMRRNPADVGLREEAVSVANGAARTYAGTEQGILNELAMEVALDAWRQAHEDLDLSPPEGLEDFHAFIFEVVNYVTRIIASQADRDVVAMAQHIRNNAIRVDFNTRSGMTASQAASAVMFADASNPAFRFVDRIGRKFKSSKHIRDTIRQNMVNVYNEVYMAAVFDYGHKTVFVTHPDPNYKWFGTEVSVAESHDIPSYYDVRDEVFHPSSEASISIKV